MLFDSVTVFVDIAEMILIHVLQVRCSPARPTADVAQCR